MRSALFRLGLVSSVLTACGADPAVESGATATAEEDLVGRAVITIADRDEVASASVVLGPQRQTLVPRDRMACGTAPSATDTVPTGWIELKNPTAKRAVVSLWTSDVTGGPSVLTSLYAYTSPTAPTTSAELADCVEASEATEASYGRPSSKGSFRHAAGAPLVIPPNSSLFVLAVDRRNNRGVFDVTARTEALVDVGPARVEAPNVGKVESAEILLSDLDVGPVATPHLACGTAPASTAVAPRAWVEIANPHPATAVLSLWVNDVVAGPSILSNLAVYEGPQAPTNAAELGACTAASRAVEATYGRPSSKGSFRHAAGQALVLEANTSTWVLVDDMRGARGVADLVVRTEHLQP